MAGFSQLLFTCSQDEDYVGSEKKFSLRTQSENAFKPYFQEPSSTSRLLVGEIQLRDNNSDVGGKEAQDEEDCQFVEPTKKRKEEEKQSFDSCSMFTEIEPQELDKIPQLSRQVS